MLLLTAYADADGAIQGDRRHWSRLLPPRTLGITNEQRLSAIHLVSCWIDWREAHPITAPRSA